MHTHIVLPTEYPDFKSYAISLVEKLHKIQLMNMELIAYTVNVTKVLHQSDVMSNFPVLINFKSAYF